MTTPILATKLYVPPPRPKLVLRPRLMERLNEGLSSGCKLTLISAPAGSGKTTLLSEWVVGFKRPVAWLSLDEGDRDPARFLTYLVAGLQTVAADIGAGLLAALRAPQPPPTEAILTALLNELAPLPERLVLILDDYHLIEAKPVDGALAFLLEHLPPQMHLVIATREDPDLPLARLRARGQLTELRAADLRFTAAEAAEFLNPVMGLSLSAEDIAALENHTEGWIAGLLLAALSLQDRTDATKFIAAFTGGHHYILDYLMEEVLHRQSVEVQAFLLRTSILDQMCGPLCDAVTGQANGQAMLERLEHANLFTIRLGPERQWYRYHHLLAEVLRLRLERTQLDQVSELHRRAATWCAAHQLIDDAVRHALAAGNAAWAAQLVEEHVDGVLQSGEGATLRRWLSLFPEEVVGARPRLAVAQALAAFNVGRFEVVEPLLADAERALATGPTEPYARAVHDETSALANVPATIALLRASLAGYRGDAEQMSALTHEALSHLSASERGPRYSVRWNLALADWLRGHLAEAEHAFADIVAEGQAAGPAGLHLMLSAGAILGRVQRAQGRLSDALRTYQEGLDFAARIGATPDGAAAAQPPSRTRPTVAPSTGMAHVGMAEVFYARNQFEHALRHVTEGITLGRRLTSTQPLADGLTTLAWIRQARREPAAALAAMDEAFQVILNQESVTLLNPVPAERARLWLAQGHTREAARWIDGRGLTEADEPSYPREREYFLLARVLLSRGAAQRALALLERLGALAEAQARNESLIEARILQALALDAVGDQAHAMLALAHALTLAEPEGYVRIFVDEGLAMVRLLRQAESRGLAPDYMGQLLAAGGEGAAGVSPQLPPLPEALSERELEILKLISAGLTTQEIAEELVIAVGTVRTHLKNIYGKLDAHSRLQAVERARALKLL